MNLLKIFLHRSKLKKYNIKSIKWELGDHSLRYCSGDVRNNIKSIKWEPGDHSLRYGIGAVRNNIFSYRNNSAWSAVVWRVNFKLKMSRYLINEI